MSKYPAVGTAPIRCGRTRCTWRGYETDLKDELGCSGDISWSVCPACGYDSYNFMTPDEIKAWESKKAPQAKKGAP